MSRHGAVAAVVPVVLAGGGGGVVAAADATGGSGEVGDGAIADDGAHLEGC